MDTETQTYTIMTDNKNQRLISFYHTLTFSITTISAANHRKVYSAKVILRRCCHRDEGRKKKKKWWFVFRLFMRFTACRVTRWHTPAQLWRHEFDSDVKPLPRLLSCVIPHLLPVDPPPNNVRNAMKRMSHKGSWVVHATPQVLSGFFWFVFFNVLLYITFVNTI